MANFVDEEGINIFDPDAPSGTRGGPQGAAGSANQGGGARPQVQGEIMPGAFMSNDDCFDLFIDFIDSDEWLLPIESFIDYFCLLFPTQDYEQDKPEKMKIFTEYRSIVKLNLESFLTEILNYNNDLLSNLLAMYE